eukprot:TRINITY_DN1298_c0_g1_i1.p1 TRINITY_DN1298_c0_g1~~TRINITY_DN1298_c0_g1_i1.p1  ORF type:complete len:657 (+),score=73.33 TRINITY_DN1298_c0_g1_i1:5216-7186(+)
MHLTTATVPSQCNLKGLIKGREIHVSCFEVFVNCIYDLLKPPTESGTEGNISSHYAPDLSTAISVLQKGLQKRKASFVCQKLQRLSNGVYEQNQSHVFINVEVSQKVINSLGDCETAKGVFTLIDLAGYEGDECCIGKESAENSMLQNDSSILTDKLNYTKMSDCGRLAKKVKVLGDIVEKSLCSSLRAFRAYILGLPSNGNPTKLRKLERASGESESTLVELFSQNLKTDYRIYIMGHIDTISNTPESATKAIETLSFCNSFKNIAGEFLALQEDRRTKGDTYEENGTVSNLESMLKELRLEENPPLEKSQECFQFPTEQNESSEKVRIVSRQPTVGIPEDLVDKMADLISPAQDASRSEVGVEINASISKIPNLQSDRDKIDGCLSEVFGGDERELFQSIKKNAGEIEQHLNAFCPVKSPPTDERDQTEGYSKLMDVIRMNQSYSQKKQINRKKESGFSKECKLKAGSDSPLPKINLGYESPNNMQKQLTGLENSAVESSIQLQTVGLQLAAESMSNVKRVFKRLLKGCLKPVDTNACLACKKNRAAKIHVRDSSLDEPVTKHVFLPGNIFTGSVTKERPNETHINKTEAETVSPKGLSRPYTIRPGSVSPMSAPITNMDTAKKPLLEKNSNKDPPIKIEKISVISIEGEGKIY